MKTFFTSLSLTLILLTGVYTKTNSQTTLNPGEVVILEFNGNGTDGFTFMPLVDLEAGTQIHFTDYGWGGSSFQTNEESGGANGNMITYTAPSVISAGTMIRQNSANIGGSSFSLTTGWPYQKNNSNFIVAFMTTAAGHDGLIVFQGTPSAPSFIWAWQSGSWGGTDYYWNSELPTGLINGVNAIYFADLTSGSDLTVDDGYYSGPTDAADAATWRARVANPTNWTTLASGTAPTLLYPSSYTVIPSNSAPTVTTQAVSGISKTSATGNGNVTATGGANITERGFYWSTNNGFANGAGTKVSTTGNWSTTGAFTQEITGLSPGSTYYVKAFATNSAGTEYGSQVSFTTKATPVITWSNPADITYGTLLSTTQLNATADVAGTFIYSPDFGTVLSVGDGQTLQANFNPTDAANYESTSKTVLINVILETNIPVTNNDILVLYPNPTADFFAIAGLQSDAQITLSDLNGLLIVNKKISIGESISVHNLSKGLYIIEIITNGKVYNTKLIKK